jgi:hypothetical protein
MGFDRRRFLGAAAGSLVGASALPELVDRLAGATPARPPASAARGIEQHLLDGIGVTHQNGVEVLIPPLHHAVVTAKVRPTGDLHAAQRKLEAALRSLDERYELTPAGLGVTVAWGLPYFHRYVASAATKYLPFDRRAQKPALLDARRFPSDPAATLLEANDVAVLLRSDKVAHIDDAMHTLFDKLDVFRKTSVRRGFVGGGFKGGAGLPKQLATAAGVPGADLIPHGSELFLGFTSSQKAALGPSKIANFETLGLVDLRGGYFHGGTHMHLSHITEDLESWYLGINYAERVTTMFRPGLDVKDGTKAVPEGPPQTQNAQALHASAAKHGRFGHSASIQPTSRLQQDVVGPDGTHYPKGTAIPQRGDFNSLDNPFEWSASPGRDGMKSEPTATVHFVSFNPSSDDFHRNRLAMDGVMPDGTKIATSGEYSRGFNAFLRTTHRQNFLVPPRAHRSFPLAEL